MRKICLYLATLGFRAVAVPAHADVIDVVNQVSTASYSNYLYNALYTHTGDNRNNGYPEHDLARDNIFSFFSSLGLTTVLAPFTYNSATYYNVIAIKEGATRPNDLYIVGSHFDSVNCPGADDNASGVAGVMEAARVLSGYAFDATLVFAAFDLEEDGLIGSWAYARAHTNDHILSMIALDMIAFNYNSADSAYIYGRAASDPVKTNLQYYAALYGGLAATVGGDQPFSDHAPFEAYGFDACVLIENHTYNPNYHRLSDSVDTPNYIDTAYATKMTRSVVGFLAAEGGYFDPFATNAVVTGQANPANGGSVAGGGTYPLGSNAVLTATPSNGWLFLGWNDGSTNNPLTLTVASNTTCTANFAFALAQPAQFFFQDGGGQVAALLLNTNGNILTSRLLGSAGNWQLKAAGDVDGDGMSDLLFQTAAGEVALWFLNTNDTLKSTRYLGTTGAWQVRACADYDGNGKPEIFFQNTAGAVAYWQTTTNGTCTNAVLLGNMGSWQLKTAADVDGDGKAELFWQRADGLVAAWFHNPGGSIRSVLIGNPGSWELRAAVDVDGDGSGDLAWQTPDGKVAAWFMNTNGTPRAASFWWSTGGWKLKAAGR